MHFAEDVVNAPLFIREYSAGLIKTNSASFSHPVVFFNNEAHQNLLPASVPELNSSHFQALAGLQPELILLGTGILQQFPHPSALEPLFKKRIGFEVMTTDAACRTFNLLLAEDRSVLAALFTS